MKQHFCPAEKTTITYQGKCNWCGEREALAQTQEPVALPCCGYTDASAVKWNPFNNVVQCHNCGQVYTTPPQRTRVGLTDEDQFNLVHAMNENDWDAVKLLEAAEAKLKELNT